jgi:hypothetical protein
MSGLTTTERMRFDMATDAHTRIAPARGDTSLALTIMASAAAIIALPVAFAAYAHSRPLSEAVCETTRELMFDGNMTDVTSCRVLGVEVQRSVTPVEGR